MDKAPDAFRTISEVADDLDIPQHVLRFWETRFSQIRPMKRSGGRRYYRPDDVDLLKGIRHLLYGQGYTIRGVQRILKEQGLKSVQGLAEESAGLPDAAPARTMIAAVDDAPDELTGDAGTPPDIAEHNEDARIVAPPQPVRAEPSFQMAKATRTAGPSAYAPAGSPAPPVPVSDAARVRLQGALQDLLACQQLLDAAARRS